MTRQKKRLKSISFSWVPKVYPSVWADTLSEVPATDWYHLYQVFLTEDELQAKALSLEQDFPRLVFDINPPYVGSSTEDRGDEDVLNEIGQLAKPRWLTVGDSVQLRKKVLHLANKYGPPYHHRDHTLQAWLSFAVRIRTEFSFKKLLDDEGYEVFIEALVDRTIFIYRMLGYNDMISQKLNEQAFWTFLIRRVYRALTSGPKFSFYTTELKSLYFLLIAAKREHRHLHQSVERFRLRVGNFRFNKFGHAFDYNSAAPFAPSVRLGREKTTLHCSVGLWVEFKFAELWWSNARVLVCPGCETLFAPARINMKYCRRRTCADKVYTKKKQSLSSA